MFQQFSVMLALLLVIIAGVTVLIMLEMGGSTQEHGGRSSWSAMHRLLGYLFLVLFAVLLSWMVFRAGSFQENMPVPVLALLLVPLIMIKVVVARQKSLASTRLILLGIAIFGLSFGLTGMAAYYYTKQQRDSGRTISDGKQSMSMEPGQAIINRKCSKCHTLDRIITTTVTDWTPTVSKMASFDSANISDSEVHVIAGYLNQQNEKRQQEKLRQEAEQGRKLVAGKCATCHSLDKVLMADKDEPHWRQTIEEMIKLEGNPEYLSEEQKNLVVSFLSNNRMNRRGLWAKAEQNQPAADVLEGVRSLVARKCSAGCHTLERVLRTEKSREEWKETLNSMIEITGDPGYLSPEEKEQILNFLSLPPEQRGQEPQQDAAGQAKSAKADIALVSRKCGVCHSLQRVHQAEKSSQEWAATVNRMVKGTGDPNYLTEQEKKDIITIISSWKVEKEPAN